MNRCGPNEAVLLATGDDYEYIAQMSEDLNVKREIILEADAETLARMRKEGHARRRRLRILLSRWDFDC